MNDVAGKVVEYAKIYQNKFPSKTEIDIIIQY